MSHQTPAPHDAPSAHQGPPAHEAVRGDHAALPVRQDPVHQDPVPQDPTLRGAPAGWHGPAVPAPPTNTKAILAVSLLWAAPAAIVFGVLARKEIRRTGEGGWGLATWGMGLGIASVALYVMYFLAIFAFYAFIVAGVIAAEASGGVEGFFGTGPADPFDTDPGGF